MSKIVANDLNFAGSARCLNLPNPTNPQDAATRAWSLATFAPLEIGYTNLSNDLGDPAPGSGVSTWIPLVTQGRLFSGGTNVPKDLLLIDAQPFNVKILDSWCQIYGSPQAGAQLWLRTASGGLGSIMQGPVSGAAIGVVRETVKPYYAMAAGTQCWVRLSDSRVGCYYHALIVRDG